MRKPTQLAALVLTVLLTSASGAEEARESTGLRLLFVGNSLTYTNDLPGMLATLLEWAQVDVERIETEALPNFGLPDHWRRKRTRRAITEGRWDVVILQQGPSATEGRPSLLEYSRRFAGEIRRAGARPGLFMVWPSARRSRDFPGVSDSYRTAALEIDGLLFPVGEAWRAAWRRDPELPLYGPDGFHPSPLGTYLAALVLFEQLADRDPASLPPRLPSTQRAEELSAERARLLQEAAADANAGLARP